MTFETIEKMSAPEMVADQVLKKIDAGELSPGKKLPPQRDMAKALGVGRSSVREAINALVVMGYLEAFQGKGTFIRKELPDVDPTMEKLGAAFKMGTILDLMEARELLECKSAELAAERADPSQTRKLKTILKDVEATKNDYSIFLKADIRFHNAIAEATGNVVICQMTKLVLEKVIAHHATLKTAKLSPQYRKRSIHTAKMVLKGVEEGDGLAASQWMGKHLNAIRVELKEIM